MAYKQKGCTPVTAKIQRVTKGGMVQQPLLNMGAPVKMKASSPAKNETAREKANEARIKMRKSSEAAKAAAREAMELKKGKELASKEFVTNNRGRKVKNPKYQPQTIQPVKGADISKLAGGFFGNDLNKEEPKSNRIDFPIKPPKKDPVIKRKKVQAIAPKIAAKVVSMETKSEIILPKDQPKAENVATKKQEQVAKSIENKENRAKTVRAKGEAALASGNKEKALRLKRREERILERAEKKKTQSSKAIEPK